jgi:DNA-binding MarR family transcriptional regulator
MSTGEAMHVGNLLLEAQRRFRQELIARAQNDGYGDLRIPHLHVFGNIDPHGTRLTDLAVRAGLGPSAMLQIVDDLERGGYVIRNADPTDRRAKLVTLTDDGLAAMRRTRAIIATMEAEFAATLGAGRYETMRAALAELATQDARSAVRRDHGAS